VNISNLQGNIFTKIFDRFTSGVQLAFNDRVVVDTLEPYTATDISVEMTSPSSPGIYESKWRMSTATGNFFGEQIWVIISVEVAGTLAITQQMSKLDHLGQAGGGGFRHPESGQDNTFNPFRTVQSENNME